MKSTGRMAGLKEEGGFKQLNSRTVSIKGEIEKQNGWPKGGVEEQYNSQPKGERLNSRMVSLKVSIKVV